MVTLRPWGFVVLLALGACLFSPPAMADPASTSPTPPTKEAEQPPADDSKEPTPADKRKEDQPKQRAPKHRAPPPLHEFEEDEEEIAIA